ncbi:alpha-galactosidase [Microbacterium sp. Marseille-Q6965]|uniref:alpha-galactosidase n=1 Tax=Microbacterium sp. Marseille-Q6965 TaxID=2965072 RepID=UPI0021B76DE6|nr:alpha-galactosidase [Microbacterium sp. Marseille-Q6965]
MSDTPSPVLLRAAGTSVVVALDGAVPRIVHWGADVGDLGTAALRDLAAYDAVGTSGSEPDVPRVLSLWATERDGWVGTPSVSGHASGAATTPRPRLVSHEVGEEGGTQRLHVRLADEITGLTADIRLTLDRHGVLAVEQALTLADDAAPYTLDGALALMPVPERAAELLDFTGRWCRERAPQRSSFGFGAHVRRSRRGRPGHDSPFLLMAGTAGFGFRSGEVWATHLAWSGDQRYLAERLPEGAGSHAGVIGAGEGLAPGEVVLAPGDAYRAPTVLYVWSDAGMDGVAARLHDRLRARPGHPVSPRPLVLNTWEAVYFDHDLPTLERLVERAARVGVERVVLDDGWFGARRDATRGLGDWFVSPEVWPQGLSPLVEILRRHGMSFGLWFEPEMISEDSDLARAHPDWVLGPSRGRGGTMRGQHVLDISRPDAWAYLRDRISALVDEYDIAYLKWDHNRELLEAVAQRDGRDRPIVREQTLALYRLMDELRRRHPGLEIESCSAGGGRIDLGILARTDRVWASDCNDPVERARIQQWTGLLLPPELIGGHVGPPTAHTTGRTTGLAYRLATALFGHAGVEWNLLECSDDELDAIRAWGSLYRELRPLLHSGRVVHADGLDAGAALEGVVAHDGTRAVYRWSRTETVPQTRSGVVTLPGLTGVASDRVRVRIREEFGPARTMSDVEPSWVDAARSAGGITVPAVALTTVGLPLPALAPQQAMIIDVQAA